MLLKRLNVGVALPSGFQLKKGDIIFQKDSDYWCDRGPTELIAFAQDYTDISNQDRKVTENFYNNPVIGNGSQSYASDINISESYWAERFQTDGLI